MERGGLRELTNSYELARLCKGVVRTCRSVMCTWLPSGIRSMSVCICHHGHNNICFYGRTPARTSQNVTGRLVASVWGPALHWGGSGQRLARMRNSTLTVCYILQHGINMA